LNSPEADLLQRTLKALNIPCSDEQMKAFALYLALLKKWSRAYNLTSITQDRDIVIKHFIDSALYLKAIPERADTLLDVGSGAGFPGLPIKILRPSMHVFLLDPSRKKTSFLKHTVNTLSLQDTRVLRCRIEDFPCAFSDIPERFQVIVTRALYSTAELLRLTSPLCDQNGIIILSKGPSYKEEIKELNRDIITVQDVSVDDLALERYLLIAAP